MQHSSNPSARASGRSYFPGLNTLRFYAALSVVIIHIPSYGLLGSQVPVEFTWVRELFERFFLTGQDAVTLFFCLSGFLITYLLLDEQAKHGRFSFKRFYLRRTSRIWPLYYLIVVFGLVILSVNPLNHELLDTPSLLTVVFLSGHIGSALGNLSLLGPLWSIGIEEWFYMAWPPLLRHFTIPKILTGIVIIRVVAIALLYPPHFMQRGLWDSTPVMTLLSLTRFECMAIGAFGAWIYFNKRPLLRVFYRLELLLWAILLFVVIFAPETIGGFFYDVMISIVSIGVILNVSTNPKRRIGMELPLFKHLGQVTYGIYMYHMLVIHVVAGLFIGGDLLRDGFGAIGLYMCVPTITVGIAWVSYHMFEKRINPPTMLTAKPALSAEHL